MIKKEYLTPVGVNQKSFYKKAQIITDGDIVKLKSYNTIICEYNTKTKNFKKIWGGYSRTTAEHIKAFINLFNINFNFNKKNWLANTEKKQKFYIEYSNGFFTANTKNSLIFDNLTDAEQYAEQLEQKNSRLCCWVNEV